MIYTVTINPAIDKVLFLDAFERSKTARLNRTLETIGGKGTHVSINLNLQGIENIALGVALGANGKKIIDLLHAKEVDEKFLEYEIEGFESRTNYEIVEISDHTCTMLTEKGPILPRHITDDLVHQIQRLVEEGDSLILTGDASNVEDTAIYSKITKMAKDRGIRVFLDSSGNYLLQGLESEPFLIKPNLEELAFLSHQTLTTIDDIIAAIRGLRKFNIPMIAMTWGWKGAVVKNRDEFYCVHPIEVNTINEAGCGDAFLSAIVAGIEKKETMSNTLKRAAAIAAATAESELTVGFDLQRASELMEKARVEKISG